MKSMMSGVFLALLILAVAFAATAREKGTKDKGAAGEKPDPAGIKARGDKFARFEGVLDATKLPESEKKTLAKLLETGPFIDRIFWRQNSHGGLAAYEAVKKAVPPAGPDLLRLFEIHYGMWDRTDDNAAFFGPAGRKAPGSGFYPEDLGRMEFDAFAAANPHLKKALESPFTVLRRDPKNWLSPVWFNCEYGDDVKQIARILDEAASQTKNESFKTYLALRAKALLDDNYYESDKAWLDIAGSELDAVVAPYETYDDALFGIKAGYEGVIMVTDKAATARLEAFKGHALDLEKNLPIPDAMKKEKTGAATPIGVYDVAQYSGQANAGIKSIAASLPNDEKVRDEKGAKTIIFRNVMEAKFEKILKPIARLFIAEGQLGFVGFDAFFQHSLLHELAHPLGVNYTFKDGKLTDVPVRAALKDRYSTIEECKADVVGLYNIGYFVKKGVMKPEKETEAYVTQVASIFRTVRFGAGEDHGKANMIQFNFLREKGAITFDAKTGKYGIDVAKMKEGLSELAALLLTIEANGDYEAAGKLIAGKAGIPPDLQDALKKIERLPTDVEFAVKVKFK
ncbi:MAG: Zn-dependent hydrolase [Deltaproteobacteria bacterium]|nr:Zn-dependent hydrolase [Deltaproteobacteria bacterium]